MGAQWPIQSSNFLVNGVNSANYTCGFLPFAAQPAASKCTVPAGGSVGVSYYHGGGGSEDPVLDRFIARSHKGPFIVYMAKSDTGAGNVWFKVFEEGKLTDRANAYTDVKWSVPDTLLANGGTMRWTIPSDISPGNYLIRTEIIAMHDTSASGAQPYVHCVEVTVTGNGAVDPPGIAIPGYVKTNDPGFSTQYNIYNQFNNPYPIPGPRPYVAGSIKTSQQTSKTTQQTTSTTSRATSQPTSAPPSTTRPNVPIPKINVGITVKLALAPKDADIPEFIYEITQALGIPAEAIVQINVDLDQSTATSTVIHFIVENVENPATYQRVDPIATAYALKEMAANKDARLTSKSLLGDMEVLSVDEPAQEEGTSSKFVGSSSFIIMISVIGGVLVLAGIVAATIVLIKKRKSFGWV
eukprot:TRINITY_DN421_c0_g1_i1.p1 TRINITY_DN421_c0_g1~~TRINITY_DN421_c0_g1_i1.p1  ORF type:complete len:473 (-),score=110.30 TRINITY_DN421_c0_g1_i1:95-1327(-)